MGRVLDSKHVLAKRASDLNRDWAQRVVRLHAPEAIVRSVECLDVDIGTTSRIKVQVNHNGPESLPRRWFVKLPSASWRARVMTALPRLLHTEVRFYKEIAPRLTLRRPETLAAVSRFGRGTTLVMGDVTAAGAIAGHPSDALNVDQVGAVVELLATLHASFWNIEALDTDYAWLAGPVRRLEDALGTALAVPLMQRGLQRAGDRIPEAMKEPAMRYARGRRQAMQALAKGPRTLTHHDCHAGNLFWQGAQPGLLDWQLIRLGEGVGDLAYLFATALTPELREAEEVGLLAHYQHCLAGHGVKDVDASQLLQRYRAHLCYPFEAMVVTLAIGGMMDAAANTTLIHRAAQAVARWESFEALG